MTLTARKLLGAALRLPYLPLWLAPFLLLSPVFLTGKALFWGTPGLQFVPWWSWAWQTLQSGHLPLWNPLVGMGAPLLANYQSALFYPPTWVYFLLAALGGTPVLAWGQALLVSLHLAWAGIGTARLVRILGLGALPQAIAGLAFGLSGYLVARAGFLSINSAAAWLPWLLAFSFELARPAPQRRVWVWMALASAMQLLSGHAQTTAYSLVMVLAWTGFWAWQSPPGTFEPEGELSSHGAGRWRRKARGVLSAWGRILAALMAGAGAAAVQLLPTAEYLLQSQRAAAVDFDFAMTYSFWPWRLLSFVAPDLFGSPVHGDYWGYGAYWEDAVYIGLLPIVLALGVIIRRLIKRPGKGARREDITRVSHSLAAGLSVWIVVTLILALGQNTPIYPWLYRNLPGFDMFQAPARFMLWAEISLAILAAYGVSRWKRPEGRALYWTRLGTAGAVAVGIGAGLAWAFLGDVRPTFIRATALAGFWGTGIGLLALKAPEGPGARPSQAWSWLVCGFLALDLIVAGWGLNPGVALDFYREGSASAAQVVEKVVEGRLYLDPQNEYDLKFNRFLKFSTFDPGEDWQDLRASMLPNLHLLDGVRHTANFDPLVPARYARWQSTMEVASTEVAERLLNLSAVTVVEKTDENLPVQVYFEQFAGRNRLSWVPCARPVKNGDAAWQGVVDGIVEVDVEVLIEGLIPDQLPTCLQGGEAELEMISDSPNRIDIAVETEAAGWLVLADTWYPGWRAEIDGDPAQVLRANYLFRAVFVPAGRHRVQLLYRPLWFYVGLLLSGLAICGLGMVYALRRS